MLIAEEKSKRCHPKQEKLCQWVLEDPPGHRSKLKGKMSESELIRAQEEASAWIDSRS